MKVFTILIVGALVGALGYLFGTEAGRQRKDDLLAKAKKGADSAADTAEDAAESAADAAADLAESAADTVKDAVDQLKS